MLIGAHVSTAGGLVEAHGRGVERGCAAIQVFNQSPRMWRPTSWKDDDMAEFLELMDDGPIGSVVIHAVYLINTATEDAEMREEVAGLAHPRPAHGRRHRRRRRGAPCRLGAKGDKGQAMKRSGKVLREALAETEGCALLLEDTAGSGATLGRSFEELAELIELGGGDEAARDLSGLVPPAGQRLRRAHRGRPGAGDRRLRRGGRPRPPALPARERLEDEARIEQRPPCAAGHGRAGHEGCAAFLSEPRFEGLPIFFEGPGFAGKAPEKEDVQRMKQLRRNGLRSRARSRRELR